MFSVTGLGMALPLHEGAGSLSQAFLGLKIFTSWIFVPIIQRQQLSPTRADASSRWTMVSREGLGSARRMQKILRAPKGLWGEELGFVE